MACLTGTGKRLRSSKLEPTHTISFSLWASPPPLFQNWDIPGKCCLQVLALAEESIWWSKARMA